MNIKSTELRIGNWIKGCNGNIFQVDACGIMTIDEKLTSDGCPCGVEITPEILEKAGFELTNDFMRGFNSEERFRLYKKKAFRVSFVDDSLNYVSYNSGASKSKHVQYLHQLQNLYFALTGNELQITL